MKKILQALIKFLLPRITRLDIRGWENIPKTGSFVVASNHQGLLDAIIGYYTLGNLDVFTVVGEKWGQKGFFRFLGKHLDFLFIDRFNPDLKALREILERMRAGRILVIAPEGTRSRTGQLLEGKPGASYLAAKLGYPILPIAINGTSDEALLAHLKRLKRLPVTVRAGQVFKLGPIPAEEREAVLQRYTDEIMCRIAIMLPEEVRGVYANHPRLKELMAEQEKTE
jgi:1-acyl-sn-glycerol-3-phosphate acyltransferase